MSRKVTRLPTAAKRRVRNSVALEEAGNVRFLGIETAGRVPVERVLHQAGRAHLSDAVVIGTDPDGEIYFALSVDRDVDALWLLEVAKKRLIEMGDP